MKIGVFDSGIGGKAIADSIQATYPKAEILYVNDSKNMPYGGREEDEIIALTEAAIQPLLSGNCDCIVIACNTATAAAIEHLREMYTDQKFIGLEPMVKPASLLTLTGTIGICATPFTLRSERYLHLKDEFAAGLNVIEPDCSGWAAMIEHDAIDDMEISKVVTALLAVDTDVIVLACTHYNWIKEKILELVKGRAIVIDPSEAINQRIASLLKLT